MNFALWRSFLPEKWNFHEMFPKKRKCIENSPFWQKAVSKSKMQESRPYLKFNFTACTTSPYPLGPFWKLGNGIVWFWSYFYTFLPCNQQFAAQFSYRCNSLSFPHYVKCDTFKSNCWKWTVEKSGLQVLRKGFSGSQRCLQFNRISWWPCTILYYYILLPLYGRPCFYIKSMQKIFWIFLS